MPEALQIPIQLLQSLEHVPGYDEAAFRNAHEHHPAISSYRVNPFKHFGGLSFSEQAVPIPWSRFGYRLAHRPQFIFDPIFHAGGYYVQEASSMFLEQAMLQKTAPGVPLTVLDLCAAPGGKSTHLLSLLPENSMLVSNEVIKTRATILAENITKWGVNNVIVTHNDPADFGQLNTVFDVILADAPCSGSGLFRKDADAANEWSEANVQLCSQRQKRILADVWPSLKTGGLFIYATCSYSPEENEQVCDWLMNQFNPEPVLLHIAEDWGVTPVQTEKNAIGYRFWPHRVNGEGFFMACFIKSDDAGGTGGYSEKKSRPALFTPLSKNDLSKLPQWVVKDSMDDYFLQGDYVVAIPPNILQLLQQTAPVLQVRSTGCTLGKMAGKDLIPDHALAMSARASRAEQVAGLNLENALRFLKKETFEPGFSARGWYLAQYKQYNLGWFKHLGNRVNNYYPSQLRILKALPQ